LEESDKDADRRRWPRVPVLGHAHGRIYTEAAAPILDLSEGGALLDVPCALRPRSLHSLRLALEDGQVLSLMASVVRSHAHGLEPIGSGESRVRYRAAVQFVGVSEAARELLRQRTTAPPPSQGPRGEGEGRASVGEAEPGLDGGPAPIAAVEAVAVIQAHEGSLPELSPVELSTVAGESQAGSSSPAGETAGTPPEARTAKAGKRPFWRRALGWLFPAPEPPLHKVETSDDRREVERVPLRGAVKGRMSLQLESEILSLSEGGMMVQLPFEPALGSELSFTLAAGEHPITVRGHVRNSQEVKGGDGGVRYSIGVEFLDLAEPARGELSAWLAERAGLPEPPRSTETA
jgi:hypothetical protein